MNLIPEIICASLWIAVGAHSNPLVDESNFDVCLSIAEEANAQGVNPIMSVSVGWIESRFTNPTSGAGARGPLQIIPRYWCPEGRLRGCDLVENGISAIDNFYKRYARSGMCGGDFLNTEYYSSWSSPLCHYNSGNRCNSSSRAYARAVIGIAENTSGIYSSIVGE